MTNISIKYLEDKDDKQQVLDLIYDIAEKSKEDKNYKEMAMRIAQVFVYLKEIGVPPEHLRTLRAQSSDGFEITLVDVVKELTHHKPLLETRINWPPVGAFRAVFSMKKIV